MNTVVREDNALNAHTLNRCSVSWSAIVAGALVAFSLGVIFNILNAGLGLVAFPETYRGLIGIGIGGYLWLLVCGIVSMFLAGFVSGILSRHLNTCFGALHGFLAWSLALLLSFLLISQLAAAGTRALSNANARTVSVRITDGSNFRRFADETTDAAGTATIGIFFLLLVGAASAVTGGYMGAKKEFSKHMPSHTHIE